MRSSRPELDYLLCQSPVGWLGVVAGPAGVREVVVHGDAGEVLRRIALAHPQARPDEVGASAAAVEQLREYFSGTRHRFDLCFDFGGLSPFATAVLLALTAVPYGGTLTYGQLAQLTRRPGAARAVGRAMATNPLPIIVPCHRVLGVGGKLTGYSGGEGIATKQWLLRFEAQHAGRP
jgi:methylated-DNA-[protein]-cysteine S-methyltransferase